MQSRRGFLRTIFGAAVGVATGGLGKVAEALTTKPAVAKTAVLAGFRGSSFLDSGYVFAPYIPLQVTPTFLDPTFAKSKAADRYANRVVLKDYYGGEILSKI